MTGARGRRWLRVALAALVVPFATQPARTTGSATLLYRGGGQGRVVFDGRFHASRGFRCKDCHTDYAGTGKVLFPMRRTGLIAMEDHGQSVKCFACHNGRAAFDDCSRCHRE